MSLAQRVWRRIKPIDEPEPKGAKFNGLYLVREEPEAVEPPVKVSLAQRAKEELGYDAAQQAIDETNWRTEVTRMFVNAGLVPFTEESVKAYKDKMRRKKSDTYTLAQWKIQSLGGYRHPVPEFVLETALKAKEILKQIAEEHTTKYLNADLEVHELVWRWPIDPFLVVRCGGVRLYLEVWNEAEYKEERVV